MDNIKDGKSAMAIHIGPNFTKALEKATTNLELKFREGLERMHLVQITVTLDQSGTHK